ncbi:tRNA lysidine(34) synthetase TilS [Chryseobacterium sp. RG1]|uniref:tRNA(Ile)-lysidine synthase n=1 Tax=Chryseobacterium tagetis TaxID=2801334 RepID=A0ABS8A5P8_9FLAO|nr:tRNA lysidine(34) synthetase TilS [Chryseobacterium tagetis]MCA6069311.1 tRNA lysidine(34) synthetase TilS [Chryseobacterium tagetis]
MKKPDLKKELENLILLPENHTYLLAVSGGVDSMVLAYLFNQIPDLNGKFQIAHINYHLRNEDSNLDQKLVSDFCKKNDIKFHLYEVSEKDQQPENSIQLWARELRYNFFKKVQQQENLEFLVTAHHLNDQLETFIINLSKAAGINGLSGIPSNENNILRPLLHFTKEEIYEFAKENSIDYREDLSNKKSDYLRNKIRLEITPQLLETNDHFLENFRKSISYLNQTKDFVKEQIKKIEDELTTFNHDSKIISKDRLEQQSDFVQFEILKKYGFDHEEIPKIFKAENGSYFFSKDYQLLINYDQLVINLKSEINNINNEDEILLVEKFDATEDQIVIDLKNTIENIEEINKRFEWDFNAEKLKFPLRLRRQHNGDEFFPSGFSGKKKVSKFFRDEKLSILARQKIWVLVDRENSILGIIPFRQDRRNAKDENTNKILKIINEK